MKPTPRFRHSLIALATGCAAIQISYAQTVEVDPATAIPANYGTPLQAYEFTTDVEGWTATNIDSLAASGGALTGSTTSGDPLFTYNLPTAIPLGYGTIVDFAVKVDPMAAGPSGGNFFYGDFSGGISAAKAPAFAVPEDNAFHTVRITFPGGVKNLSQLRIDPTSGGFPKTVSLDYVRVYGYQPTSFSDVTLTASDGPGTSSYNSAGNWSSAAAPTTDSNYFTGAFQLRTPAGTALYPFGGSALTIGAGGALLFDGSGGEEIRKLTLAGGNLVQDGTGAAPDIAKLFVPDGIDVTAAARLDAVAINRSLEITGSFSGSAPLTVAGGAAPGTAQSAGKIVLKSDNTAYTGTITVGSNSGLDLDHDNAVAGADVVVESGSRVFRTGTDANGPTTAHSWSVTGRGNPVGNDGNRGAIYYNLNGLNANLAGDIAISGAVTRIGEYSSGGTLAIDGNISGTGLLELWGGGAAESHIQTFILNGASTISGGTDVLSDTGSQTHLRLGGDDRLATNQRLRLNATWGSSPDGAGVFFDLNGFDQTLTALVLDGAKKKTIYDKSGSGTSLLTLSNNTNAFDTNGGSVFIQDISIRNIGGAGDSGVSLDGGSVITLTNSTWDSAFYTTLGKAGNGTLTLVNSRFNFGGELLVARGTASGTLNVDATSTASTPNFFRIGDGATGTATVNLNGGTLAAKRFFNNNTGTGILNLDGGTLRATGSNLAGWLGDATGPLTVNLKAGGISIDSDGFNIRAVSPISADLVSTGGGLTKKSAGALYLDGMNTYTGATSVSGGTLGGNGSVTSNVSVDAGAGLAFHVTDPAAGASVGYDDLSITGSLSLPDPLVIKIDSTGATFPETNATGLTLVTASGGITGFNAANVTFDLTSFTGYGSWKARQVGTSIVLDYTAGTGSPFVVWINSYAALTNPADRLPGADPDGDSVSNFGEFAFGGDPTSGSNQGPATSLIDSGKLVHTIAVRSGSAALFPPSGAPLTATKDGVTYTESGSQNLATFGETVNKRGSVVLGNLSPTPPAGYEYVTFELATPISGNPKGFLRATATGNP